MTENKALNRLHTFIMSCSDLDAPAFAQVCKDFDEVRQALQSTGWRDISTAPRDGTRILACGGGLDAPDIVEYVPQVGAWSSSNYTLDDTDHEPQGYNRPTHWQPLPTPPDLKEEDNA